MTIICVFDEFIDYYRSYKISEENFLKFPNYNIFFTQPKPHISIHNLNIKYSIKMIEKIGKLWIFKLFSFIKKIKTVKISITI